MHKFEVSNPVMPITRDFPTICLLHSRLTFFTSVRTRKSRFVLARTCLLAPWDDLPPAHIHDSFNLIVAIKIEVWKPY